MKAKPFGLITMEVCKPRLTMRVMISAMHELRSPLLSKEENLRVFGKCLNQHGHDYWLEVTVQGQIDSQSGMLCNRDEFEDKLQTFFVLKYDKSDLNHFFKNTTGEVLALEFFNLLKNNLKPMEVIGVRLQETPKNFFSFGTQEYLSNIF